MKDLDEILEDYWNAALSCTSELDEGNWTEDEYLKAQSNYRAHYKEKIQNLSEYVYVCGTCNECFDPVTGEITKEKKKKSTPPKQINN